MPPKSIFIAILLSYALSCGVMPASAQQIKWTHDTAHCKAIFKVGHDNNIGMVTGWFNKIISILKYDGKDLSKAKVTATIFTESLNTGTEFRDQHLRSDHFFDVEKFPQMKFRSSSIAPSGAGKFRMTGELEIKGKKKTVTFDCVGPKGPVVGDNGVTRIGVVATTHLKRQDFDFKWNREVSPKVLMVGDDVDIILEMEYLKAAKPGDTQPQNPPR